MTAPDVSIGRLAADLKVALVFYTRLPLPHDGPIAGGDLARASWAAPIAGAVVGALGAAAYGVAHAAGLGPLPAAGLALLVTIALTGGLHEVAVYPYVLTPEQIRRHWQIGSEAASRK